MTSFTRMLVLGIVAFVLSACDVPGLTRDTHTEAAMGKALYEQYCSSCHGISGEGQPDWKTPGEDGVYPAPPHTTEGHTWHHADPVLLDIIKNGNRMPSSTMPAFGDQLTEDEMVAILAHIKTFWDDREREFQELVTQQYMGSSND